MSGLRDTFHLNAHSNIFLRSSFNKFAHFDKSYTIENNEVSSANNLADDSKIYQEDHWCILRKQLPYY